MTLSGHVAKSCRLSSLGAWTEPMRPSRPFKGRHFPSPVILLCVRRHLAYSLSYGDLQEMMAERGMIQLWINLEDVQVLEVEGFKLVLLDAQARQLCRKGLERGWA
jgi:hypothetical protein